MLRSNSLDTDSAQDQIQIRPWQPKKPNQTIAIAADGINMTFYAKAQGFQVLKGVELGVPKGDIQMVVGPSGAGKTTLLLILAGLLTPTAGHVCLLGQDLSQLTRQQLDDFRLHHIGILFQDANLLGSLTAIENVEVMLNLKGINGSIARQQAHELLVAVGLNDRVNYLPHKLSGGQQQRVAVARALAGNPQLIIADEPTASLDSENGQTVIELMHKLSTERGCTVLIATHDHRITPFADQIARLEDGVLTEQ